MPSDRIDELIERVQSLPDPAARAAAVELLQAVMGLHAEAISRMLELAAQTAPGIEHALAADESVSRMLVLHGLHPDDFDTRLRRAFAKLETHFDSRGARVELLDAAPELVRLRFHGKRPGAGAAARQIIENGIYEAVPELGALLIEGVDAEERREGFVPLSSLLAQPA